MTDYDLGDTIAFFVSDSDSATLFVHRTAHKRPQGQQEHKGTNRPPVVKRNKLPGEFKNTEHRRQYMRDLMRRKRAAAKAEKATS